MLSSIAIFALLITMLVPFGMMDAYAGAPTCDNEFHHPVTIDNDFLPTTDGYFQVGVGPAGDSSDVQMKPIGLDYDYAILFDKTMYYETDDTTIDALANTVTDGPCLLLDGSVESSGTFLGSDEDVINWTSNSVILPGATKMDTQIDLVCPGCDQNFDGLLRLHDYFDEDVGDSFSNCVLVVRGSVATDDLELFIVDPNPDSYGVSQGGAFGANLVGATFDGWTADKYDDLEDKLRSGIAPDVSPTGIIDLDDLPPGNDPLIFDGDYWGPGDITTVMSYTLDNGASVTPMSFGFFTPAYAAGMASITTGMGGVPSPSTIPDDGPGVTDHYLSYKAKQPKGDEKFEKFTVTLDDQFESATYTVEKPDRLFNPVQKTHDDTVTEITDDESHYVGYKIKELKGADKFEHIKGVSITDQFGELTIDIKKAKLLLVPSAKDLSTEPNELNPVTVDHYKCYDAKETKDTPKFEKRTVDLLDQFADEPFTMEVKKPKMLCVPVHKTHDEITSEINGPENYLTCYDVKKIKHADKFEKRNVFTNNQFGPEELKVEKQEELCVPSKIIS